MNRVEEVFQRVREMLAYFKEIRYTGNVRFTIHFFVNQGGIKDVRVVQENDL